VAGLDILIYEQRYSSFVQVPEIAWHASNRSADRSPRAAMSRGASRLLAPVETAPRFRARAPATTFGRAVGTMAAVSSLERYSRAWPTGWIGRARLVGVGAGHRQRPAVGGCVAGEGERADRWSDGFR
jgi:hypothetical protein